MAVPGISMKSVSSDRILRRSVRQVWQAQRAAREVLDSTALNLISLRPLIPRQNILLIEAIHDALAEPTEELWRQWGEPEIWRVPHGHFSFSLIGAPCLDPSATRQEQDAAAQPDGAANRSQPVCPEENRASAPAGSGR
jgi:hypothetical protein